MNPLIEKAMTFRPLQRRETFTKDQIELALAWAKDEVTLYQVTKALGHKNVQVTYTFLARALRDAMVGITKEKSKFNNK